MDYEGLNNKQSELVNILFELAKAAYDEKELDGYISRFRGIYDDSFRHQYSDFYAVVAKVYEQVELYSIEFLQQNLESIKDIVVVDKSEDGKKSILKLCDHVKLEILRFTGNKALYESVQTSQKELEESNKLREEISAELKKAQDCLGEANEKLSHVQGETISMISIFAAVTLAFSGGLSYISSAIASLNSAPFPRVVFVILLCGFIIYNLIFALLFIVGKLTDKNLTHKCKQCDDIRCKKCNVFFRSLHCAPYLVIDAVLFLLMTISFGFCF